MRLAQNKQWHYNLSMITEQQTREILYKYAFGRVLDSSDTEALKEVINNHPRAKEKIGSGISHLTVEDAGRNTRCFYIHHTDGTCIDFSFIKCFKKSPKDFPASARRAVEGQIYEFRDTLPTTFLCPINGMALTPATAHIDHVPPMTFKQIIALFIKEHQIDIKNVSYDRSGIGVRFNDSVLAFLFAEFHRKHAVLRAISKEANLSLPRI